MLKYILIIFLALGILSCKGSQYEDGIGNGNGKCKTDDDCIDGRICSRIGQCTPDKECFQDSDCLENENCDPEIQLCVPNKRCESDHDCKKDLRCVLGICTGCDTNDDCELPDVCNSGACLAPQNTCKDKTCAKNQICNPITGECQEVKEDCNTNKDCSFGAKCENRKCSVLKDGCNTNSDCKDTQECRVGVCIGCQSDEECKGQSRCVLGACLSVNIDLCTNIECEYREICDPQTGQCYLESGECREDLECRPGTTCQATVCMGCVDDESCHPNMRCSMGMCLNAF